MQIVKLEIFVGMMLCSLSFFSFGEKKSEKAAEKGYIANKTMFHIGIVVHDIQSSVNNWAKYLGLSEKQRPEIFIAEGHEMNPTRYRGKPSDAKAKLAFFSLDNTRIELIEPIGNEPSHWREFLKAHGEGVHHIAFRVTGMGEKYIEMYNEGGYGLLQHGGWDGGEYGYMDTLKQLGVTVELIEMYQ